MLPPDERDAPWQDDAYDELPDPDGIEDEVYDPGRDPDPDAWLALDEGERILLVRAAHRRLNDELPTEEQRQLHATVHVVAENQLATGDPPEARQALTRLLRAGVGRHSAVHAIANEIVVMVHDLLRDGGGRGAGTYEAALRSIDPEDWVHDSTDPSGP